MTVRFGLTCIYGWHRQAIYSFFSAQFRPRPIREHGQPIQFLLFAKMAYLRLSNQHQLSVGRQLYLLVDLSTAQTILRLHRVCICRKPGGLFRSLSSPSIVEGEYDKQA